MSNFDNAMEFLASQETCTAQIDLTGSDGEDYLFKSKQHIFLSFYTNLKRSPTYIVHKEKPFVRLPVSMTGRSVATSFIITRQAMLQAHPLPAYV